MIVPEIVARGAQLTELTTNNFVPFTYMFDLPFFTSSFSEACPQMTIIRHIDDLWQFPSTATKIPLDPKELTPNFLPEGNRIIVEPGKWHAAFRQWLADSAPPFSAAMPVVIALGTPLLQWPLSYDEPKLVATFGRILRFREDTRRLAGVVLYALNQKYNLELDASASGLVPGKYYGAHLRTASDASAANWTPYSVQCSNYLASALDYNFTTIYLTSGNPSDTTQFISTAAELGISVTTKLDLLSAPEYAAEKAEMEKMTWDQQALIDWEVLLRSSLMGGTQESSFAWNVALKRHVVIGGGTWYGRGEDIPARPIAPSKFTDHTPPLDYTPQIADVPPTDEEHKPERRKRHVHRRNEIKRRDKGPQSFQDAASTLFGAEGQGNFFHLSMWP